MINLQVNLLMTLVDYYYYIIILFEYVVNLLM